MYLGDLAKVLKIIKAHDEDDVESAEADFQASGFDHQFVLEFKDELIGVTGYREVTATDKTAWLSWTYLKEEYRGRRFGKKMTEDLIGKLRERGARTLFVKVSNYNDPVDGNVYETALKMYESVGFVHQLVSKDFYDEGEDQIILGLALQSPPKPDEEEGERQIKEERPVMRFDGLFEIADTEGSYSFSWFVKENKGFFEKRGFSTEDLLVGLRAVKADGGRRVFLTFPSNLVLIHMPLQSAGFKFVGKLEDYYECGVHELHFTHDLANI